jgi:hypothetical protein
MLHHEQRQASMLHIQLGIFEITLPPSMRIWMNVNQVLESDVDSIANTFSMESMLVLPRLG